MKRVLLLCPDPVGARMSGPAIRALETARVLSRRHRVTLVAPGGGRGPAGVRRRGPGVGAILEEVRRADVVITQGVDFSATWPLFLLFPDKPVVWDLTSPVTLENLSRLEGGGRGPEFHHRLFLLGLERGDFFVCGGERQRDLYRGAFASIGRGEPNGLCVSAPFGIPEEEPRRREPRLRGVVPGIREGDFILLWPGGVWDWTDPLTPIRAVARLGEERKRIHLVFLGRESPAAHEARSVMLRRAEEEAGSLGVAGESVHFLQGWRPYGERGGYLLESDAGISAHGRSLEARFAYRTRLVDCVWAGAPVICSGGDEVGAWVEREGLGRALPPGDVDAWVEAIREAARGAPWYREAPAKMEALRPTMTWKRRLAPLAGYLESPRRTSRGWAGLPRYLRGIAGLLLARARSSGGGRRGGRIG